MSELEGKVLYLVRHGETYANVNGILQGLDDALTPTGELQAEKLADRASRLEFDALISSDAVRAMQTASIVAKRTRHTLETQEFLREIRVPTALIGKKRTDPEARDFMRFVDAHGLEDVRMYDEENVFDMHARACTALRHLEQHAAQKVLVVTHGMFLRMLVTRMVFGETFDPNHWKVVNDSFRTINTGITIWRHTEGRWRMFTWNDHAHLG